jgi:serine/threonine-protein kinase
MIGTMLLQAGTCIDDLVIEGLIGQGSHAAIFQVITTEGVLGALKVLTTAQPVAIERLRVEGRILMELQHPNVVGVYRVLDVHGLPAILMELVEGPTLGTWLDARGRVPIHEVLELFKGIARGVEAAHALGLVHRDLNPGNVLLATVGDKEVVPKVTDFGIARALDHGEPLTQAGPLGTPAYVAPEQWQDARNATSRSDLFSLGCILYELVTGNQAFPGDEIDAYRRASAGEYLRARQARPDCPEFVDTVIDRLLRPDPEARYLDIASVLEILFLDDVPDVAATPGTAELWSKSNMSTEGASLARFLAPGVDTDTTVTHPLSPEAEKSNSVFVRTDTPAPAPDRLPWIVGGLVAAALLVVVLAVALLM